MAEGKIPVGADKLKKWEGWCQQWELGREHGGDKRLRGEWGALRALHFRRSEGGVMVGGDDKMEVRDRVRLLNAGGVRAFIEGESGTATRPHKRGRPTAGGQHMDARRVRRMTEDMAAARAKSARGGVDIER